MIAHIILSAGLACILAYIYRQWRRISLSGIPGPKSNSFFLGNLHELYTSGAGEADFKWTEAFGSIVRYKGILGEDHLMISDPKALQYILHTSAYHFFKETGGRRAVSHLLNGHSLNSVDGDIHRRQRKVMLPAFGGPEARALFPIFRAMSQELVLRWKDIVAQDSSDVFDSTIVNIPHWLSRATLDAIGEAAFDYKFGALDNSETELGKAYHNINLSFFGIPSSYRIFWDTLMDRLPASVVEKFIAVLPTRRYEKLRFTADVTTRVAKRLVQEKRDAANVGKGNRDVMSLLVNANASTNPKARLSDEELYAEMRIILFAGHETTSTTLTWTLWELAKQPEIQRRLRTEIREAEAQIRTKSNGTQTELSLSDIEGMLYLQAVLKEGLRYQPAISRLMRLVNDDEVIPLSKPLRTVAGVTSSELAIPGGTKIMLSLAAYNRDKDIWGPDADTFNPDRWLSDHGRNKGYPSIGVVGNTLTFSSGTRSCIGWRFAMTEMQCFLVDLVGNFEFQLDSRATRIKREGSALMFPVVDGETEDGVKLPLRISITKMD